MRFRLEIDLDAVKGDPADELGRILRYWGGNVKHIDLTAEGSQQIYDSAYAPVGVWRLES